MFEVDTGTAIVLQYGQYLWLQQDKIMLRWCYERATRVLQVPFEPLFSSKQCELGTNYRHYNCHVYENGSRKVGICRWLSVVNFLEKKWNAYIYIVHIPEILNRKSFF